MSITSQFKRGTRKTGNQPKATFSSSGRIKGGGTIMKKALRA